MTLVIIVLELIALYVLSRRLTQNLYIAVFLVTKSRPIGIGFLSLLFFPGTVIHELAHMFVAEVLGVRTGGLTLVPEGLEEKNVKTGSVMIAQTDPVRRAVIGIAPVIVGLLMLGVISYYLPGVWEHVLLDAQNGLLFAKWSGISFAFLVYALFAVSNTMFSSPEDLEGFWPVVIVLLLVAVAGYLTGIRLTLTGPILTGVLLFLTGMAKSLGYVTALNIVLFLGTIVLIRAAERITKRHLIVNG